MITIEELQNNYKNRLKEEVFNKIYARAVASIEKEEYNTGTTFSNYSATDIEKIIDKDMKNLIEYIDSKIKDFSKYYTIVWKVYVGCESAFFIQPIKKAYVDNEFNNLNL